PVMGRRTRFQPDHTARNAAEERQHLAAPQPLAQNRRTLRINAVNLKNMLGYVQSDCRNLAHGWLPFLVIRHRHQIGTSMPQGGHPPHHSITTSARASRLSGTVTPSAFAVLRLMTSSYLVGACTGRSLGFSPLRIRST